MRRGRLPGSLDIYDRRSITYASSPSHQVSHMAKIAMDEPATLCRRIGNVSPSGRDEPEMVVAKGPFIIMAAGYLALAVADRDAFCIRCAQGEVESTEVEEAMLEWKRRGSSARF